MEFQNFGGRYILEKVDVPLLYIFQCEVPVKTKKTFYQDSLYVAKIIRVGVPYLKQLVDIVGVLRTFLLLDFYCLDRHLCRQ